MVDKPAVNARKRDMLIGSTGDKGKPHIARQQLKRHLALNGQHGAVQTKLTCDKAAIEVVTGNLPIGRQNRDGNRQVKTAASFTNIAGCQVDGNARPRDLEAGRAHGAPDTSARLHHLHTRNAEHLDAGTPPASETSTVTGIASTPRIQAACTANVSNAITTPANRTHCTGARSRRHARRGW